MLHEKLECYTRAIRITEELGKEVAKWPKGYSYLSDQLKRAFVSIVLNIAEGNARISATERRRFFEVSRASLAEVSACVDLMKVFGLLDDNKFQSIKLDLCEISKMLWGLIR